jgi:ribulose kinase
MSQYAVPTVVVVGQDGNQLIINAADYTPERYTLWADKDAAAKAEAEAKAAAEAEAATKATGKKAAKGDA